MLTNLLNNAGKYSRDGSPIVVTVAEVGLDLHVSVQDHGVGIDADEAPHVFDRFYRASNTGQADGSGLGLYITRRLVEAHGGRIWVDSTPGVGSVFTFTVPLQQSAEETALTA